MLVGTSSSWPCAVARQIAASMVKAALVALMKMSCAMVVMPRRPGRARRGRRRDADRSGHLTPCLLSWRGIRT
jgi:hypothetical protein